jgi:ubiquinol-cytochrome c reductase cytochrome c1 subunit
MRTMMASCRLAGAAASVMIGLGLAAPAQAAEGALEPMAQNWSFNGLFGTFDLASAQRGFQVYREVCSACHSLNYIAFRNLAALGYDDDQVKAIAAQYEITDGPNDQGEMFERPGRPTDHFPPPFENAAAARLANGGALPPDLSLITKARESGPDYVDSLLQGYQEPPADVSGPSGTYYNLYFPGHFLAMPPPLTEGAVTFADGTEATVAQMAHDVTVFLTWAGEPTLEARKESGLKVMLFLIVLTALLFATKRKVWAPIH